MTDIISEDNAGRVVLVDAPTNSTVPIPLHLEDSSGNQLFEPRGSAAYPNIYLTGLELKKSVINSVSLSMQNDLFYYNVGSRWNPIVLTGFAFDEPQLKVGYAPDSSGLDSNVGPGMGIIYDFFNSYEAAGSGSSIPTVTLTLNSKSSSNVELVCLLLSIPGCKWNSLKSGALITQFAMKLLPLGDEGLS